MIEIINRVGKGYSRLLSLVIILIAIYPLSFAKATELIVNGGFEQGSTSWTRAGGSIISDNGGFALSGANFLWLGGVLNEIDSAYQDVTIPSNITDATLSFYFNINSLEGKINANDTFVVTIRNITNTVLATVGSWSNKNQTSPGSCCYTLATFSLLPYAGQTVRIYFASNNNATLVTNFRVDNVSVSITGPQAPTVTTLDASFITVSSAALNGSVNPNGSTTSAYFQYGLTTSYGATTDTVSGIGSFGNYQSIWSGLTPNTTYHYRFVAYNNGGISTGADKTFTTLPTQSVPTVSTLAATSVGGTSATLNGKIVSDEGSSILERRIEWAKSTHNWGSGISGVDSGFMSDATSLFNVSSNFFSVQLSALTPNTEYKYRVWARNAIGWSDINLVNVETFTTEISDLSITTSSLASATVGESYQGEIAASGGQTPYTWSISGEMPSGMTLYADTVQLTKASLNGTPNTIGTFDFTVTVKDSSNPQKTASKEMSLTVDDSGVVLPDILVFDNILLKESRQVLINNWTKFTGVTNPTGLEGQVASWSWRFSNAAYSQNDKEVHHSFTAGSFGWAELTITDIHGNTTSTRVDFIIKGVGNPQEASLSLDPVNLASGNFIMDHSDLIIPGRGLDFVFQRFYNSKAFDPEDISTQAGPLGWGWSHSFETRLLAPELDGSRSIHFGDGHGERYTFNGTSFIAAKDVYNRLTMEADGIFVLTGKNQIQHRFASDASPPEERGRLISINDRNGNTIILHYDQQNRIDHITDTVGRVIQFEYDSAGHLSALVDPIDRRIEFGVDTTHDLRTVTNARGNTTTFTYDGLHQLLTGTDARGHRFVYNIYDIEERTVKEQFDANNNRTVFKYHFNALPLAYTVVTREASDGDEVTIHYHDDKFRLIKRTDGLNNFESFEYDQETGDRLAVVDKNLNRFEYRYVNGNIIWAQNPDGGITEIEYNSFNDPILRKNANGVIARWEYDENGNQLAYTFPYDSTQPQLYRRAQTINEFGQITTFTDANGHTTQFFYDAQGNNWKTIDAALHESVRSFDGIGRIINETDGRGNTTRYILDENGNIEETIFQNTTKILQKYDENENRISVTDQLGHVTTFSYDKQDRLYKTVNAELRETIVTYDALGRKRTIQEPGQGSGLVTTYMTYDLAGNLKEVTDPILQITNPLVPVRTFDHDKNGNVISVEDADGVKIEYAYDSMNRRTKVILAPNVETVSTYDLLGQVTMVKNAKDQITTYTYNAAGQQTGVTDADLNTFTFGYDFEGNQTSATHAANKTRFATYTPLNQLESSTDENQHIEYFFYDAAQNIERYVNAENEEIWYSYDELNRLTSIIFPTGASTTFDLNEGGYPTSMTDGIGTTLWTYTNLNRVETVTDPFGKTLEFSYDPSGNRKSVTYPGNKTATYAFDPANRPVSVTDWLGRSITQEYTDAGRLSVIHYPNGVHTTLGHDSWGREVDIAHRRGDEPHFIHFGYTLDDIGNVTDMIMEHPLVPSFSPQENVYTYDNTNQLATLDGIAFVHDKKGNILAGKLSPASSGQDSLTFDYQNRLTNSFVAGTITTHRYNGLGHRLEMNRGGETTRFVIDGTGSLAQIMAETDGSGAISAYYLYLGGLAARILPDDGISCYHVDRSGNVTALTDGTGSVTDLYQYDPFGVSTGSVGSSSNPFRYLGGYGIYDNGDGTLYIRARHYHPDLGRFLSRDPLLGNKQDGQSLNRYVYALNNPLALIDVTGLAHQEGGSANSTPAYLDATNNQWLHAFAHEQGEFWTGFWSGVNLDLADGNLPESGNLISRAIGNASGLVAGVFIQVITAGGEVTILAGSKLAPRALQTTTHGAQRIAGTAATRGGVLSEASIAAVRQGGQVLTQADGATVRILQNEAGRFNVVVEGQRGIITTFENLSKKSLYKLGKNYDWK